MSELQAPKIFHSGRLSERGSREWITKMERNIQKPGVRRLVAYGTKNSELFVELWEKAKQRK